MQIINALYRDGLSEQVNQRDFIPTNDSEQPQGIGIDTVAQT
jgi:hypothetical protein